MRRERLSRSMITHALGVISALAGTAMIVAGAWIPIKAELAQSLLEHSWQRALAGERQPIPWPWADTWPVAKITFPSGASTIVLSGTSGHALAFAPGHLIGSPLPGSEGNAVVAAHRDTHFRELRNLREGDPVMVQSLDGLVVVYHVSSLEVVDESDTWILTDDGEQRITLLTCYPFDGVDPDGALRYVVRAEGRTAS